MIGGRSSDAIDYRFDKVPKRFFPLDLPASVRAACSAYASFSGYTFIGFDLRRTRDGVFLLWRRIRCRGTMLTIEG